MKMGKTKQIKNNNRHANRPIYVMIKEYSIGHGWTPNPLISLEGVGGCVNMYLDKPGVRQFGMLIT